MRLGLIPCDTIEPKTMQWHMVSVDKCLLINLLNKIAYWQPSVLVQLFNYAIFLAKGTFLEAFSCISPLPSHFILPLSNAFFFEVPSYRTLCW